MKTDTIAAVATALSDSGIGIIRISGDTAVETAARIYQASDGSYKLGQYRSHTIHYGFICEQGEILDEVMITVMKAPNSYTREDTVEINCHGGVLLLQRVLEAVLKAGARLAEPGEFTKRAFLNGRIDLVKAEAVMDMIQSRNEYALKSSVSQLRGSVSEVITDMRNRILHEIAFIESALDDPEHISTEGYPEELAPVIRELIGKLERMISSADNGKILKEGINSVIVGKPNVGKSSLLNLLAGEEKAIVTDIAGTTRDVLEEQIRLHGISLNMIDTAGIRNTQDVIEKIGVERARKYASSADLLLYVLDRSVALNESDDEIIRLIKGRKFILLLNKEDLEPVFTFEQLTDRCSIIWNEDRETVRESLKAVNISAREGTGIEDLELMIRDMFFHGDISFNEEVVITNMRHKEALNSALVSLQMVSRSLDDNLPEDFYSIDLMSAYAALGSIIGEEVGDDLVNEIFSKFCMGK